MAEGIMQQQVSDIFVNCPFDSEYMDDFLKPMLFTLLYCGYKPRIALERSDSSEVRINKIWELIEASNYSIHDLSRIKASKRKEYYRLNMPFEIGMDFGCKHYKNESKKMLILETESYAVQKALSDIAGCDVKCYKDAEDLVRTVRNWLYSLDKNKADNFKGGQFYWLSYLQFRTDMYDELANSKGFGQKDIEQLEIGEFEKHIKEWIKSK
jgi:hypothetical protein